MTKPDELAREIEKQLRQYNEHVEKEIEAAKKEVAQELSKDLQQHSPEQTGDYQKGWAVKKAGTSYLVHNKTNYQLTHLLEHGHAKKGGGRVGPVVHIRPAEAYAIKEYLEKIEKALKA